MRVWSRADANELTATWVLTEAGPPRYVLALLVHQLATGLDELFPYVLHYVLGVGISVDGGENLRECPLVVLEERTFPNDARGLQWSEELKARYVALGWAELDDEPKV